ncbi:MAG: molybdopterin-guanine dinucleotide biosynthesis protein MobA [Methanosaeta sp. PtaU1.Bin112]|nr:MAG: molybdopterin-guanine dinucleotide biosynthesis protein MobA [Methanosaeta sp. PtaU1.Bin112]
MRSAVILAGGRARRLGEEKALLVFDKRPLFCWTADKLSQIVDEIVIVARDQAHAEMLEETNSVRAKVAFTWDRVAGFGPVAGLLAGMERARGELAFATGCDLPFLNMQVIESLFEMADEEGYDAAVPVQSNGYFEPLHSVYLREKMFSACERALERSERRVHAPLQELRFLRVPVDLLRPIDPDLLSFFNLNTREDLEVARKLWPGYK